MWDQVTFTHRSRVVDLARTHRLLTIFDERQTAEAGGLMSYSPKIADLYRRAAIYVDISKYVGRVKSFPLAV
jgi:putative ABC transport system substrate-binding protein